MLMAAVKRLRLMMISLPPSLSVLAACQARGSEKSSARDCAPRPGCMSTGGEATGVEKGVAVTVGGNQTMVAVWMGFSSAPLGDNIAVGRSGVSELLPVGAAQAPSVRIPISRIKVKCKFFTAPFYRIVR